MRAIVACRMQLTALDRLSCTFRTPWLGRQLLITPASAEKNVTSKKTVVSSVLRSCRRVAEKTSHLQKNKEANTTTLVRLVARNDSSSVLPQKNSGSFSLSPRASYTRARITCAFTQWLSCCLGEHKTPVRFFLGLCIGICTRISHSESVLPAA